MRRSTIDLTMNVYTNPKLLDVQGALDALPALTLDRKHSAQVSRARRQQQAVPSLHEQAAIRVKFGPSVAKWRRSPLIGPIRDATQGRFAPSKKRTR